MEKTKFHLKNQYTKIKEVHIMEYEREFKNFLNTSPAQDDRVKLSTRKEYTVDNENYENGNTDKTTDTEEDEMLNDKKGYEIQSNCKTTNSEELLKLCKFLGLKLLKCIPAKNGKRTLIGYD